MPLRRHDLRLALAAAALAFALPLAASAEDRTGRAAPDPNDPALAPRQPLVREAGSSRPLAPPRLQSKPGALADKTEHFTDAASGLPAPGPTARERAKLEAARVAVSSARAAGAWWTAPVRTLDLSTPLHEIETSASRKFERLRAATPAPVIGDPASRGLPATLQSRQRRGEAAPSAAELEKLRTTPASRVTPETGKESER